MCPCGVRGSNLIQARTEELTVGFTEGFDTKDLQEAKALLYQLSEGE